MLSVILLSVLVIQLQGFSQVLRAWGDLKGGGGGGGVGKYMEGAWR